MRPAPWTFARRGARWLPRPTRGSPGFVPRGKSQSFAAASAAEVVDDDLRERGGGPRRGEEYARARAVAVHPHRLDDRIVGHAGRGDANARRRAVRLGTLPSETPHPEVVPRRGHRQNSPFASILHTCPCDSSNGTVSRTSPARSHTSTEHRPARNTASRQIAKAPDEPPRPASNRLILANPFGVAWCTSATREFHTSRWFSLTSAPVTCHRSARNVRGGRDPSTDSTTTVSADACATEIPSRTLSCRRTRTHTRAPSALNAPMSRDRGPNARDSRRAAPASTLASSRHRDSAAARRLRPRRSLRNQNRQPRHPRRDGSSSFFADSSATRRNSVTRPSLCPHASTSAAASRDRHDQSPPRGVGGDARPRRLRRKKRVIFPRVEIEHPHRAARITLVHHREVPGAAHVAAVGPSHGSFVDDAVVQGASPSRLPARWIDRVASTPSVTNSPAPSR